MVFNSAPFTCSVTATLPNGSTVSTCSRLIGYGGGVKGGQKSFGLSWFGQVRASLKPPELVIAKSVLYATRKASAVVSPTFDSHVRPALLPHASLRGMVTVELPI